MAQIPQSLYIKNDKGTLNFDSSAHYECIASEYNIQSSDSYFCDVNNNIIMQNHYGNFNITSDTGVISIDSNMSSSNAIVIEATNSNGGILNMTGTGGYNVITANGNISLLSKGADIDIGVSAIGTPAGQQTQNVNIESFNTLNMSSGDMYFVSSDVISFVSNTGDIEFGTNTNNGTPVIKFKDGNVLINQATSNLDYQLDIAVSHGSANNPGYNGIVINTFESNIASDLTLQTSNTLGDGTQCILSLGSFGSNNPYAIFQNYLAYQTGNVVIRLDGPSYSPNASYLGFGLDFSIQDIGRNIYWETSKRLDTIINLGTTLFQPNDSSNVSVSGQYSGNNSRVYLLQIDSVANPNTFSWSNNGGSSFQIQFVPIVAYSPITLDSGLQVIFTQATGFHLNQQFTFQTKITAIVYTTINPQTIPEVMYTLQQYYSYIKTVTPSDIVIKTNDHEKMRITGDGAIGIQQNIPKACLDLNSNYNKILLVNQVNSGYQINPSISHLDSGGYVIVWNAESNPLGTLFNNYGQRYLSDGTQYGNNFLINTGSTGSSNTSNITTQSFLSVAGYRNSIDVSNHFIVVWSALNSTSIIPTLNKIYCQIYHNNMPIRSFDIPVDSTNYTTSNQLYPRVAGLYNGNYVIVWNADDSGIGIYTVQSIIISDDGIFGTKQQVSGTVPPSASSLYNATYAYVAGLPNDDATVPNGFVVGYMIAVDNSIDPRYTIAVKIMNSDGTPYSNEIPITIVGNSAISSISDGLLSVAEINLHQVNSVLGNGGFIITFYRNYQADTSLYQNGDIVMGLTSGATATIFAIYTINTIDGAKQILTLKDVSNRFLEFEEIQIKSMLSLVNTIIIEKIADIEFLSLNTANITLDMGNKNVVAYRFKSDMTLTSDAIWQIQVNTSELFADLDINNPYLPNTSIFAYKRPLAAVSVDNLGTACITWSNGSIPSVYYQLINIENGALIGTEQRLTSQYDGLKQRDQVITHLQSIGGNDYGFVISWDNQSLNLLDTGIYQQLIGYNHSIINLEDGNCNFIYNHQNQCGIGTHDPIANLHIQSQETSDFNDPANPVSIILQNTCKHIITNSPTGLQNISFVNGSSNVLTIMKCCNSLRYDDLYPLPSNLIGFYKFDETVGTQAKDSSAASSYLSGNTAVYINTSAILNNFDIENCWGAGLINNALLFDGNIDYLFIENIAQNNLNTVLETENQLTIGLWVNIPYDIVHLSKYNIVSNGGDFAISGTYLLGLWDSANNGNLHLTANITVSDINNIALVDNISIIGTKILNDANWHHICMTVLLNNSNCTINLYVDGVLDDTITAPGTIEQLLHSDYNTYIGSSNGVIIDGNMYRGYMDELRFYNTVLSLFLITELYNYGNPNAVPKGALCINANNNSSHNLGIVLDDTGKINNLSSRPLPYTILSGELIAFSSNTTIFGLGTYFTTELTVGDIIAFDSTQSLLFTSQEYTVISIINNTLLTLNEPAYGGPETQKPFQSILRRPSIYTFFDNGDNIKGHIDNYGNLMIGANKPSTMIEISGGTDINNIPQLTLTNTENNNAMYSRKTAINFRGVDTSNALNPPVNLGHIEIGHDGNNVDNKGIMRVFTNNGTQENNVISITSAGYIGIGNQNTPLSIVHITSQDINNDCAIILQSKYNVGLSNSIFDERGDIYFAGINSITDTTNPDIRTKVLSAVSGSNDSNSQILNGRLDFLTNNSTYVPAVQNGIESRMSITHTGSVGVNILNPPNAFTVAPELRLTNGTINTISTVSYNSGLNLSTITVSNNIFVLLQNQQLFIGGTCVIGNAALTITTILSIIGNNQITVDGDMTLWNGYNIYIHYPGLNVSNANGFIGINTTSMNSPLSVNGAISTSIITVSSNTILDESHHTVLCDTTSNNISITLPLANSCNGRMYKIKNIVAGINIVSVNGNGANIDGSIIPYVIAYSGGVMQYNTFQSDGANWWIV